MKTLTARHGQSRSVLILFLCALLSGPLWAHAQLLEVQWSPNPSTEQAPQTLRLLFNEPIEPLSLRLIGSQGDLELPAWQHQAERLEQSLPELPPGHYWLTWRVRSVDGHVVSGDLPWQWGEHQQQEWQLPQEPGNWRTVAWPGWLLAASTLLLMLYLVGNCLLLLSGLPVRPWFGLPLPLLVGFQAWWQAGGHEIQWRAPVLLAIAWLLYRLAYSSYPKLAAMLVSGLLLTAVIGQGHSAVWPLWLQLVYGLHWLLAALWLAALAHLCRSLPNLDQAALSQWLRQFSQRAWWLLLLALAAGSALLWQQSWPWQANSYSGLLLLKLGLLSMILMLAAWHRWALLPALVAWQRTNADLTWTDLRRRAAISLHLELGLLVIMLLVTAIMAQQPPRLITPLQATQPEPLASGGRVGQGSVSPWDYWWHWREQDGQWQLRMGFSQEQRAIRPEAVELRLWLQDQELSLEHQWQGSVLQASLPPLASEQLELEIRWLRNDFAWSSLQWQLP